jgi:hypothetical protein
MVFALMRLGHNLPQEDPKAFVDAVIDAANP